MGEPQLLDAVARQVSTTAAVDDVLAIHKARNFPGAVRSLSDDLFICGPAFNSSRGFINVRCLIRAVAEILATSVAQQRIYRDAIDRDLLFLSERVVYGPALVNAVPGEKKAKYPRVLLTNTIVSELRSSLDGTEIAEQFLANAVWVDKTESHFINYLHFVDYDQQRKQRAQTLDRHLKAIEARRSEAFADLKCLQIVEQSKLEKADRLTTREQRDRLAEQQEAQHGGLVEKYEWLVDYYSYYRETQIAQVDRPENPWNFRGIDWTM